MERLTIKGDSGAICNVGYCTCGVSCDHLDRVLSKLSEYEDLEEQGKLLKLPCAVGDIVYDVVLCDDGKYHIFEMKVCNISPFGDTRKGKAWNVYLEDKYTKAYRSFYDFGKTVFLTKEEAEDALKNQESSDKK